MTRVQFTQYQGKKILVEDFTNLGPGPEFEQTLQQAREAIHAQPPKSVLAVFDATGARFNNEFLSKMKEFTSSNTPYIKAAAVVGITGMLEVALTAISRFSGRQFNSFKTRDDAMIWLVQQ